MEEIAQQIKSSKHYLIGISGIPGSGKSYHSQLLHSLLPNSMIIPMDGFHLYRQDLTEQGKKFRGAAFTFNLQKFKVKIIELSKRDKFPIYFPSFDHALKDPIQNAIEVTSQIEHIIVEGLYLFDKILELDCWDMKIWIEADIQAAIQRVGKQQMSYLDAIFSVVSNKPLNQPLKGRIIMIVKMLCMLHRILIKQTREQLLIVDYFDNVSNIFTLIQRLFHMKIIDLLQMRSLVYCLFFAFLTIKILSKSNCEIDCCRSVPDRAPMTYRFYQNTGRLIGGSGESYIDTKGYSGRGKGYLNPDQQCTPGDIGPLPASTYKLSYCKNVMHETTPRPCSFYLDPQKPEQICGRFDFFIHGCNCCTPQDDSQPPVNGCSNGCVIINYDNRKKMRLGDRLIVEHYEPKQIIFEE